jgi:hypothetical protein
MSSLIIVGDSDQRHAFLSKLLKQQNLKEQWRLIISDHPITHSEISSRQNKTCYLNHSQANIDLLNLDQTLIVWDHQYLYWPLVDQLLSKENTFSKAERIDLLRVFSSFDFPPTSYFPNLRSKLDYLIVLNVPNKSTYLNIIHWSQRAFEYPSYEQLTNRDSHQIWVYSRKRMDWEVRENISDLSLPF